jgi:hypothetical protein
MNVGRMKGPLRDLHAFLKLHWADRYLWGAGTFNPRVPPVIGIYTFTGLMEIVKEAVAAGEWDRVEEALTHLPLYAAMLADRRYDGHAAHLDNLRGAIAKRSTDKATLHLGRLRKVVHVVAADRTFKDGERVSITRTEHGWFDGRLGGTVKPGSGGHVVLGDDGHEHEIRHLRDIR